MLRRTFSSFLDRAQRVLTGAGAILLLAAIATLGLQLAVVARANPPVDRLVSPLGSVCEDISPCYVWGCTLNDIGVCVNTNNFSVECNENPDCYECDCDGNVIVGCDCEVA